MNNRYTLEYCVQHSLRLKRPSSVLKALKNNDIVTWDDLLEKWKKYGQKFPQGSLKGVGEENRQILTEMAEKEDLFRQPFGRQALYEQLAEICEKFHIDKHTGPTRLRNHLRRNGIITLKDLLMTDDETIESIKGFGQKMAAIVNIAKHKGGMRYKDDILGTHSVKAYEDRVKAFHEELEESWKKHEDPMVSDYLRRKNGKGS